MVEKAMEEVKELPSGGTRLKYNLKYVLALAVVCAVALLYVMLNDVSNDKFEQIKWILTFGFSGAGLALGIYTASENGVKHSTAVMNRN